MAEPTRRGVIAGAGAALIGGRVAHATSEPIEIEWRDLVPEDDRGTFYDDLAARFGIVQHGDLTTGFEQETNASVTTEYDGKQVRLPGFMVPLDYEGYGVTAFLLVPYVGACIHVPPPPPNQIVYVTAREPYEVTGYFAPVWVRGTISTTALSTDLASIGYSMDADRIEPYEE